MPENDTSLGLCFFGNQLFYAAQRRDRYPELSRIGAIDFNFDVPAALINNDQSHMAGLQSSISSLSEQFQVDQLRLLLPPNAECWAMLPKLACDDADEREDYINILMNGMERKQIAPSWHSLSKDNFKLLRLRTESTLKGFQSLSSGYNGVEFSSAFEIGSKWVEHVNPGGSFLTIGAFGNCISVSSYILGKLRGATFIEFDHPDDLPYLWLQQAQNLPWLQGLHEQIQVFGQNAYHIIEILQPFWDDAGTITKMDSLEKMQVQADEKTYGFDLELAFPAIMLALL